MARLIYIYDPLCGWCYGAMPAIAALVAAGETAVELLPSGLFAGDPSRRLAPGMREHIIAADRQIAGRSGQRFSDAYRREVVDNPDMPFDSGPASRALTAVAAWNPARELTALHALQQERYIHGRDLCRPEVLARALTVTLGDRVGAWRERLADPALPGLTEQRMQRARRLLQVTATQGVPALIEPGPQGVRALPTAWLFKNRARAETASAG